MLLEAFRRMPTERLVIAGDGPAATTLRAAAPPVETDDLLAAIRRFESLELDPLDCRRAAERYSEERFLEQLDPVISRSS